MARRELYPTRERERESYRNRERERERWQVARRELYPTWEAYLETFCRVGGVIEAVPGAACDCPSVRSASPFHNVNGF